MGVHERTIHKEKGKATAVRSTVVLQEGSSSNCNSLLHSFCRQEWASEEMEVLR